MDGDLLVDRKRGGNPINNRRQRLGGAQMSVTFNASYWLPASRGLSHTIEGVTVNL